MTFGGGPCGCNAGVLVVVLPSLYDVRTPPVFSPIGLPKASKTGFFFVVLGLLLLPAAWYCGGGTRGGGGGGGGGAKRPTGRARSLGEFTPGILGGLFSTLPCMQGLGEEEEEDDDDDDDDDDAEPCVDELEVDWIPGGRTPGGINGDPDDDVLEVCRSDACLAMLSITIFGRRRCMLGRRLGRGVERQLITDCRFSIFERKLPTLKPHLIFFCTLVVRPR